MSEQLGNTATESPAPAPVVPEVKNTETAPVVEKVAKNSAELLELARQEVAKAKAKVSSKAETSKLQEELENHKRELDTFRSIKENYKQNPEEALARLGLTYEELTNAVIEWESNKPVLEEKDLLREEIDARFKAREEEEKAAQLEALKTEQASAVAGFYEEIGQFLQTNTDKYPLMKEFHETLGGVENPEDIIFAAIEAHYDSTGELLDFAQVADTAEAWFGEEVERFASKVKPKVSVPAQAQVEEKLGSLDERTLAEPPSFQSFKVQERDTPTSITNKIAQPKRVSQFDPKDAVRRDAISRAIDLLEQYDRKK